MGVFSVPGPRSANDLLRVTGEWSSSLLHHHPHFSKGEWFEDIVARAGFHRLDGGFNQTKCSHNNDRQRRILQLGIVQKLEPADAGKF